MEIQAKAPKKKCLTQLVRSMSIKTDNPAQQEFLAVLYATFIEGGVLSIQSDGRQGKPERKAVLVLNGMGYFDKPEPTPKTTNERDRTTTGP